MYLPRHSKPLLPLKGKHHSSVYLEPPRVYSAFLATPPMSSPVLQHDTTVMQQPITTIPDPAQYTLGDGPRDAPGTAAYYKSWAFRRQVNDGTILLPKQKGEAGEDFDDSADEDYSKKTKQTDKTKSLVMIFSGTNVRRANAQRKVNERMQRSNRRMKFLRKLEVTEPLFKWD